MTAMYEMRGEALDYKNETSADIKAGDIVTLGSKRIAVAGSDIDKNEVGAVHVTGVFAMPKKTASDVIAMGVPLFGTQPELRWPERSRLAMRQQRARQVS